VPVFEGDGGRIETRFEGLWGLFSSLDDGGDESANIEKSRLRQSLKGTALEGI
jgi:hypothetical protein